VKEENQAIIKALNMYGRVPKQWELLEEIERLHSIIEEAREYIEEKYDYLLCDDTFLDHDERIDSKQIKHILGILDGSDKE
jgi:hypothetical protein